MSDVRGPASRAQVVVITGASNGIGRAVALELAAAGTHLVLVGRDADRLHAVATAAHVQGAAVTTIAGDVRDDETVDAMVAATADHDAIDVLVHAAGVAVGAPTSVVDERFDEHYQVNVRAPMRITAALLPQVEPARGIIVVVNSAAALQVAPGFASYAGSKSAAKAWTDTLRVELRGRGVRVCSIYPGQVATDMQAAIYAARGDDYEPSALLQPAAVASAVAFVVGHPEIEVTDLAMRSATGGYAARVS